MAGVGNLQKTSAAVLLSRAMIPTVSSEFAYATTPHLEISPYDGLKPTMPVYAAGSLTEPPVSVPNALYYPHKPSSPLVLVLTRCVPPAHAHLHSHRAAPRTPPRRHTDLLFTAIALPILLLQLPHGAEARVRRVRAHAKLIEVRLADDDGVRILQSPHDGRIVRAGKAAKDAGRTRGRQAGRAYVVFDGDETAS